MSFLTERKSAEAVLVANDNALRESEARFRELADNISQFAWTADQKGWIYWYNKRWHDYTGRRLKKCRVGAGRKSTIPNMLIGLYIGLSKALKPEHLGRTHSRCAVAMVAIAGSSRALCPSATRPVM